MVQWKIVIETFGPSRGYYIDPLCQSEYTVEQKHLISNADTYLDPKAKESVNSDQFEFFGFLLLSTSVLCELYFWIFVPLMIQNYFEKAMTRV